MLPLKFVVLGSELNLVEYLTLTPRRSAMCRPPGPHPPQPDGGGARGGTGDGVGDARGSVPAGARQEGHLRRQRERGEGGYWVAVLGTLANLAFIYLEVPQPRCNKSRNIFLNFRKREAA